MQKLLIVMIVFFTSCAPSLKDKIVIAHRGAPGYLPEHTLEGVSMAHAWDVDYIEPDLVVTKDNRLVVLHDIHIDTTTNVAEIFPRNKRQDGRYYAVDFTLLQLKKLKVSERIDLATGNKVFPGRFPLHSGSFEIPTFEEFIETVQGLNKSTGKNIGIYLELKSPEFHTKENKDIAKLVVALLDHYGLNADGARVFIQCFYPPTLQRLKEEFKVKVPLIFLIAENSWNESSADYDHYKTQKGLKEVAPYIDGIGPYVKQLYKVKDKEIRPTELVKWAHELKLQVHTYTHRLDQLPPDFKTEDEFLDFLFREARVDGIFSDFADRVIAYKRK